VSHAEVPLGNYLKQVNKPVAAQVKEFTPTEKSRRLGTVGVKLGMTTLWDDWGHMVPVTVIELDRVQVVQIKEPQNDDGFYHVQLGCGQKNLKRLRKPEIGHFMKAGVPPKKHLAEFKVTKDCLLPIGYMISSRHYTPGMLVDVIGKTVGHGFSGTIKQYRFRRQPATHGNSTTTRVLGSTGCRQDPGRVFKMKKMYGRMGQDITIQ
jgi:large subunit ribosomal protein L3